MELLQWRMWGEGRVRKRALEGLSGHQRCLTACNLWLAAQGKIASKFVYTHTLETMALAYMCSARLQTITPMNPTPLCMYLQAAGPDDPRHADPNRRLVVGLVGYPNVGKSSTINALFGSKKTAVAPTPGKTKHFQTLNVSASMCLCDCPGMRHNIFVIAAVISAHPCTCATA